VYYGPLRMTPTGMMMLSALVMESRPKNIKEVVVHAACREGWAEAFALLGCACDTLPQLEMIDISCRADDESMCAFFESLTTAKLQAFTAAEGIHYETKWLFPLRTLRIEGSGYGLATVRCVAQKLGRGFAPQLRVLSFNGNAESRQLNDEGAAALGAAIATGSMSRVEDIDLQNSSLTSAGLIAIANGLAASPLPSSLSRLSILDSAVGDAGVARLADVCSAHRITFLECRRTQVSLAGARSLLAAGIRVDHDRTGWTAQLRAELQGFSARVLDGTRAGDGRY
jgi:hypothetical protein